MRHLIAILCLCSLQGLGAQECQKHLDDFQRHFREGEYLKAGNAAAREVNCARASYDSTDLRHILSYYHLGQAYAAMGMPAEARDYLGVAYHLLLPFYQVHSHELALVCQLYGRSEAQLGNAESARSFLQYAGEVFLALYGPVSYPLVENGYFTAELEGTLGNRDGQVRLLEEALAMHEESFPLNEDFALQANKLGLIYQKRGEYPAAGAWFSRGMKAYEQAGIEASLTQGHLFYNLGMCLYHTGQLDKALRAFHQADSSYQLVLVDYSSTYVMLLTDMAFVKEELHGPDSAGNAIVRLDAYLEAHPGKGDDNYLLGLETAAAFYAANQAVARAEILRKRKITLLEAAQPPAPRALAASMLELSALYKEHERYELGGQWARQAFHVLAPVCDSGDADLIAVILALGANLQLDGQPNAALYHYELARDHLASSGNSDRAQWGHLHNNMGALLTDQGAVDEALIELEEALKWNPEDPTVLYNLGKLYDMMNRPTLANARFQESLALYALRYGEDHPEYANALINSVIVRYSSRIPGEEELEQIRQAEAILLQAGIDTTGSLFGSCLDAYALWYFGNRSYAQAMHYMERKHQMVAQRDGKRSKAYAESLLTQCGILTHMGNRKVLDDYYGQVEKILSRLGGDAYRDLRYTLEDSRAANYYYLEDYEGARSSMEQLVAMDKQAFLDNHGKLSLQEMSQYSARLTSLIDYNDYLLHFPEDPDVASAAMDNLLFLRSILLDAELNRKALLRSHGDVDLQEEYRLLQAQKAQLTNLRSGFSSSQELKDSLEQEVMLMEQHISRRLSVDLARERSGRSWKEVREALETDEAVVSLVLYFHTTAPPLITQVPLYLAFIITPETVDAPRVLRLYEAEAIYPDYLDYMAAVKQRGDPEMDQKLYAHLWASIDQELPDVERIYFSPDGIFHEINVEALKDAAGTYLADRYELRYVNSPADLLDERRSYGEHRSALLAGDPSYWVFTDFSRLSARADAFSGEAAKQATSRAFPGLHLSSLPGTRIEVDSIARLLQDQGWETQLLLGEEATEEAIYQGGSPRVLHLATHGYFEADEPVVEDTLEQRITRSYDFRDEGDQRRSCLFFAGAQNTVVKAYDYQAEQGDGIMTSWEIAGMNLDSTELVVLSACESGLGDILKTEGVTGLRRAFHLAGAQRILQSLWEVDDQATQELMRKFYEAWLSGMDMDQALMEAKRYLREETAYQHPRYWAAFILSGL